MKLWQHLNHVIKFRNSIALPILFTLLLITAGIFLAGYYINKNAFYNVFEERENNKLNNIHLTIQSLISGEEKRISGFARVLKRDTDIAYSLYHYNLTGGDKKPLKSSMDQLYSQMNLPVFMMAEPAGNILYRSDRQNRKEKLRSSDAFKRALKGEQVLTATNAGDGWSLRAMVPIYTSNRDRPSAVLILGSRIDDDFAKRIAKETGSQVFIATPEGVIAGSYRHGDSLAIDLSLARKSLAGKTPLFFSDRQDFRSYTFVPLTIIDQEFCLVIATDISVVKDLLRKNKAEMVQWGVILFLGVVTIGASLTITIVHPLNDLQEQARQVAREYSGDDSKALSGGNEISTLVRAFHLMVETIRDHISERAKAEEALRETGRTLRALIAASPLAILVTDACGNIQVWNPAAARIFGWREDEAIGRANPIQTTSETSELGAILKRALCGERFSNVEVRGRNKTGADLHLAFYGAPLLDDQERIIGMTAIMADITEAKRAEDALRRSEEQLRQSQKMEAIGKLAGGIAHDFNNLLSVITGYSELLLGRLGADSRGLREIEEIRKAGERAASLTQQLLAFSRQQVLAPKSLRMNEVVSSLANMLKRVIGENIELVTHDGPDLWPVRADPTQIDQILVNLAVNARDAMPRGGRLTLSTANVEFQHPLIDAGLNVPAGPYVSLEVRDTGCGMDRKTLARIFEPFFTTKEQGKGTGLGLATVYGIVRQSGGHIRVLSEPGTGTTFRIYFPRARNVEPSDDSPGAPIREQRGDETILLVEDEEMVRELACETLRGYGYTVLEAANGQEALSASAEYGGTLHLLITDVGLPGINGLELARKVKTARPYLPVLFISGYSEEAVAELGRMGPGEAFLQKPVTPSRLSAKVREILSGRRSVPAS